jgi:hypothetical protein
MNFTEENAGRNNVDGGLDCWCFQFSRQSIFSTNFLWGVHVQIGLKNNLMLTFLHGKIIYNFQMDI